MKITSYTLFNALLDACFSRKMFFFSELMSLMITIVPQCFWHEQCNKAHQHYINDRFAPLFGHVAKLMNFEL